MQRKKERKTEVKERGRKEERKKVFWNKLPLKQFKIL